MMGPNPDSFQRALGRFKSSLSRRSPELIERFAMTSPEDVKRACIEIQDSMGRDGRMRRMQRMESFIEAMEHLGKSIEVFVNANGLVCFVWVSAFSLVLVLFPCQRRNLMAWLATISCHVVAVIQHAVKSYSVQGPVKFLLGVSTFENWSLWSWSMNLSGRGIAGCQTISRIFRQAPRCLLQNR